jgi:hypothetical protein
MKKTKINWEIFSAIRWGFFLDINIRVKLKKEHKDDKFTTRKY